jgi:hypothetical protein
VSTFVSFIPWRELTPALYAHRWKRTDTSVEPVLLFGVQWDEVLVHREQLASSLTDAREQRALLASSATVAQVVRNDVAGIERTTGIRTDPKKLASFTADLIAKARTATALVAAGSGDMTARLRTTATRAPTLLAPPVEARDYGRPTALPLAQFGALTGAHSWMRVAPMDIAHDAEDAAAAASAAAAAPPPPLPPSTTTTAPRIGASAEAGIASVIAAAAALAPAPSAPTTAPRIGASAEAGIGSVIAAAAALAPARPVAGRAREYERRRQKRKEPGARSDESAKRVLRRKAQAQRERQATAAEATDSEPPPPPPPPQPPPPPPPPT